MTASIEEGLVVAVLGVVIKGKPGVKEQEKLK